MRVERSPVLKGFAHFFYIKEGFLPMEKWFFLLVRDLRKAEWN